MAMNFSRPALAVCKSCEGQGCFMEAHAPSRWAENPYENDREVPCSDCAGVGQIMVDGDGDRIARDGIEAQRGLNDTWPGDKYPGGK